MSFPQTRPEVCCIVEYEYLVVLIVYVRSFDEESRHPSEQFSENKVRKSTDIRLDNGPLASLYIDIDVFSLLISAY